MRPHLLYRIPLLRALLLATVLGAMLCGCKRHAPGVALAAGVPINTGGAIAAEVHERTGPFDNLTTSAGQVAFAEANGRKTLTLAGKPIDEDNSDEYEDIVRVFDFQDKKTVLLLSAGSGGVACPSQYFFVTIRPDGSYSSTGNFGTCSDIPQIALTKDGITVTLPDMNGRGNETWRYAYEGLSKIQFIDPNVEKNAQVVSFSDDQPAHVRGTIISNEHDSKGWTFKFPGTVKLQGGENVNCRPFIVTSLPINLEEGTTPPKVTGESDFVATIQCPESGPAIGSLELPATTHPARPAQQRTVAAGSMVRIPIGATLCADLDSMRTVIAASGAPMPDACIVMQRVATTRVLRESTPIPGVVIVQANQTTAVVRVEELDFSQPIAQPSQPSQPSQPPRAQAADACQINPDACEALQRNDNIRAQIQGQRCAILRSQLQGTFGGDYQLSKAGCQ